MFRNRCRLKNASFHTNVLWASNENVIKWVFKLRDKLNFFFEEHRKFEFVYLLNEENEIGRFLHLLCILEQFINFIFKCKEKVQI